MKKSILFIVPYPYDTAPSQRLKFEQYYHEFEKAGYEITIAPFINQNFWKIIYKKGFYLRKIAYTIFSYFQRYILLSEVNKYDIIYVHLWGTPFGLPVFEWLLHKLSKKYIYDIDDLIYQGSSSPSNKYIRFLKSGSKVNFLMKHADHIFVSTDKLLTYTSQFTAPVSMVPATVDVSKYADVKSGKSDSVVIGWSGSHTTSKYLHLLDNVLKKVSKIGGVRIMVMGDISFNIEGLNIEVVEWSSDTEVKYLQQFDIGLHPLTDEDWVYGKSGGKLVQYMAAGIPVIASAIGPNFKVIQEGYNGFLVKTEEEWFEKLQLLIKNQSLRQRMGRNSKDIAMELYSVEANCDKYISVFNTL